MWLACLTYVQQAMALNLISFTAVCLCPPNNGLGPDLKFCERRGLGSAFHSVPRYSGQPTTSMVTITLIYQVIEIFTLGFRKLYLIVVQPRQNDSKFKAFLFYRSIKYIVSECLVRKWIDGCIISLLTTPSILLLLLPAKWKWVRQLVNNMK